jgi:hypothetical protein
MLLAQKRRNARVLSSIIGDAEDLDGLRLLDCLEQRAHVLPVVLRENVKGCPSSITKVF